MALEDNPPVTLHLFNKEYEWKGIVPAAEQLNAICRFNTPGSLLFSVMANNPRIGQLTTAGSRCVLTLDRPGQEQPLVLMSGMIQERRGLGVTKLPQRIFEVIDDFGIFDEIIAWPKPTAAISAQTDLYYQVTGAASDVVRDLVLKNAPRQGVSVTVGPALGLGPTITSQFRMMPLADRLFPRMTDLNLGVQVLQQPDANYRELRTWIPTTHTKVLTEDSGVIQPGGEHYMRAPTATRAVLGASGAGTTRKYVEYVDTFLENRYGISRSIFVDAEDIDKDAVNFATLAQERIDEALAEHAEVVGLQVELAETENFQFGVNFQLGDMQPIQLAGIDVITDRITEVEIDWSTGDEGGLVITPRVGGWEDNTDDKVYKLVAKVLKSGRYLEAVK